MSQEITTQKLGKSCLKVKRISAYSLDGQIQMWWEGVVYLFLKIKSHEQFQIQRNSVLSHKTEK